MIDLDEIYEFNEEEFEEREQNKKQLLKELVNLINVCSNKIIELNQDEEDTEYGFDEMIVTGNDVDFVEKAINKIKKIGLQDNND